MNKIYCEDYKKCVEALEYILLKLEGYHKILLECAGLGLLEFEGEDEVYSVGDENTFNEVKDVITKDADGLIISNIAQLKGENVEQKKERIINMLDFIYAYKKKKK